jgi:hypothetical protein
VIVQCSQVEADAAALLLVIVRIVSVAGCLLHISLCTTLCNKSRCLHTHNWDLAAMSGLPEHLMGPHTYQLALPCSVELALLPCFLQMHIAFQVYDLVDKHIRELDGDLEAFAADIDNEAQALGLADEETACDRLGLEGGARVRKGAAAAAAAAGGQQGRQKRKAAGRRKGAEAGVQHTQYAERWNTCFGVQPAPMLSMHQTGKIAASACSPQAWFSVPSR